MLILFLVLCGCGTTNTPDFYLDSTNSSTNTAEKRNDACECKNIKKCKTHCKNTTKNNKKSVKTVNKNAKNSMKKEKNNNLKKNIETKKNSTSKK